ncbi:MAG: LamG domain-containing protein, partial [Candidatus Parabeggiatoa sp.]|nr:LamG domain-containing protein [Candidatus Parabeggiatoa sp.]
MVSRYYGDNNPGFGSTVKINDDQFHHIVFVKNGEQLQLFIDGNLDNTLTDRTVGNTTNNSLLFLGRRGSPLKNQFKGVIDDLLIYNRALTTTEVQTLYGTTPQIAELVIEDAEDGNTTGWRISSEKEGGAAFANVFDEERKSQVMEFTGSPFSAYNFANPDGSPLSTTNFIARWNIKITDGDAENPYFNVVYWRVKTSGSVIYLSYGSNRVPLGCRLDSSAKYATCRLGSDLQDGTWHTITRDLEADLKAVAPDLEILEVEHLQVNMAGRIDDIQLLNRNDVNFHTISGTITDNDQGVSGKSLSNTGADCQPSDSQGDFTCTVPENWYGSLTPKNTNEHYFPPLTRAYSEVSQNITGQDFTVRLIEDGLEDAEDGETDGWSISANPTGDSAFANVVDSEKDSRVMEFTGNSRSMYRFAFPDGSKLSTTNFIARWDINMTTGFGTVFWRVNTTGSVIYMEYRLNTPLGCHLSSKSTYAICVLCENMQYTTWYTITRDIKADLKTLAPDIELQSVEFVLVHTAGRVDNIQLLDSLPDETVLEDAEDGNTDDWSVYSKEDEWDAAFANVFDSDKNSQVIEFTGNSLSGYQLSFDNSSNFIARWSMKTATRNGHSIFWRVKTSGSVIYLSYRSDTPLGCHFTDNSTYITCGLDVSMRDKTWHTITRDLEADLKSIAPHLELQAVEHLKVRMAGRIDDIQLLNRNDVNFHTISGTITDNGKGVSGLSLSNSGADCQPSDNEGHFSCTVPEGWFGTLTPANTNEHYFAPLTRTYSDVSEDITGQDFTVRLIEDGVFEDAEDGDTQGWSIYDDSKEDAAFSNVVESESNNRVIELTGHSSSGYLFAFPNPFSTTRFIAQWRMKMTTTEWQPVYWRVKTSGSIVYLQYGANHPEGCEQAGTYIICGLGDNMPANKWYTITRDLKADLKAVKPDLELLEVEHLNIRMAGQIDDIQLLESLPPEPQLVAHYCFDDPDNLGKNCQNPDVYPGFPEGGASFFDKGKVGKAASLDGEDDWFNVSGINADFMENAFTITAWFKPDIVKSQQSVIWFQDDQPSIGMGGDSIYFGYKQNESQPPNTLELSTLGSHQVNIGEWNCAAYTYEASDNYTMRHFLNGENIGQRKLDGTFLTRDTPRVRIGVDDGTGKGRFFNGQIDEVRIYNYALSDEDIQALCPTPPVSEVVLEDAEDGDTANWSIFYEKAGGAAFTNVFDEDKKSQVIDFKGDTDSAYRFIKPDESPLSTENVIARWSMKITEGGIGNPHINKTFWKVKTTGPVFYLEYRSGLPLGCNNNSDEHYAVCGLGYELRDAQWHNITRDLEADLKAAAPNLELLAVEHFQFNMVGRVDDIQLLNRDKVNFHTISGKIT